MNYASYYGKWDKLPDFDSLKPVKQGVLRHIDQEHLNGALLPYWKTIKKDGRDHRTNHPSGLKFTGYLKVKKAGDYTFSFTSNDDCRLVVGSKTVIETDGLKDREARERGGVHLEPGVHSFVLTYSGAGDPHHSLAGRHLPQRVRPILDGGRHRQQPSDGGCAVGTGEARGSESAADQAAPRRMAAVGGGARACGADTDADSANGRDLLRP